MQEKMKSFRCTRWTVSRFYRGYNKIQIEDENGIYISNHCKLHGPVYFELYFPEPKKIWVIHSMCDRKEAVEYAYEDFFKSKKPRWFYIFLSRLVARPFSYLVRNAHTIRVYKDLRISSTLKESVRALKKGDNLIIMPEFHQEYNDVLHEFQRNYVELAKLYYKMTQKRLKFYPVYLAPKLKKICIGTPIEFNPEEEIETEKTRINEYLKEEITKLCHDLPKHKIVLYD